MNVWRRQYLSYHPVIGWWFIPNLRATIPHEGKSYLLQTNSLGMRSDREYPLSRPDGRHRIILLGDSYTAGDGVENGARFSDLLEKSYPNLDVLNFGLDGTGTDQQLLIYETLAKPFEADAYIFAIYVKNIMRNQVDMLPTRDPESDAVWYRSKPYFTLDQDRLVLHNQPVPKERISEEESLRMVTSELYRFSWVRLSTSRPVERVARALGNRVMPKWILRIPYRGYDSEKSAAWQLMRGIIGRFTSQVRGKTVFILPLPDRAHFMRNLKPIYLDRFATAENAA